MKPSDSLKAAAFFVLSSFLASYSLAGEPRSKPFLPDISEVWTKIAPEGTTYMGRDLSLTCSGFPGTDTEFSFFVKGGIVNNLVIFFDGGEACWHSMNCFCPPGFPPEFPYLTDTPEADKSVDLQGIFDTNNPANPFKDWSFAFIPYCTGDFHWGSHNMAYPVPLGWYEDEIITIHHRCFDNFLVVLKWITEHFRRPHKIFVTGSSAGSPGALVGFPYIQEA
jgi:hypothetical protein